MQIFRASLLVLFIAGYIVNFFVKTAFLPELRAALSLLFFCSSFWLLKPLNRKMCLLLSAIGAYLLFTHDAGLNAWVRAIIENSGLISLLLTVPLLGLILQYAPYEEAITALAGRYIRSGFGYYATVVTIVNILGTFLSMASVPLCYHMTKNIAANFKVSLTAKALSRGFCANLLWSPNLIAVAVSLQYINLSWYEVAPFGIAMSVVVYLLALGLGRMNMPSAASFLPATHVENSFPADHRRILFQLGFQIVVVLAAVLFLDYAVGKNILVAVSLAAFFVPLLIAAATRNLHIFRRGMKNYFAFTLPAMANEFMLFTCVGFFGFALGATDFGKALLARLLDLFAPYPDIAPFLIIWTIGLLAMLGIHPIITISSLGICLGNINIGLSNVQVAISLMTGYIMYSLTSPFSSMTMLVSSLLGQNVFDVSVKINLGYALLVSVVITILLHFV